LIIQIGGNLFSRKAIDKDRERRIAHPVQFLSTYNEEVYRISSPNPVSKGLIAHPYLNIVISPMDFLDVVNLCLSILGLYGLIISPRYLLPRYIVPSLSALLKETQLLLQNAEKCGAIPLGSQYRTQLDLYENFHR